MHLEKGWAMQQHEPNVEDETEFYKVTPMKEIFKDTFSFLGTVLLVPVALLRSPYAWGAGRGHSRVKPGCGFDGSFRCCFCSPEGWAHQRQGHRQDMVSQPASRMR